MSEEIKWYPFEVCFRCMLKGMCQENNRDHGKMSIIKSLLFVPSCDKFCLKRWNDKESEWGPKSNCPMILEHTMVKRRKFKLTHERDIKCLQEYILKKRCFLTLGDNNEFSIMVFKNSLEDVSRKSLDILYEHANKLALVKEGYIDEHIKYLTDTTFYHELSDKNLIMLITQHSLTIFNCLLYRFAMERSFNFRRKCYVAGQKRK